MSEDIEKAIRYHYCDGDTLLKIIDGKVLWQTHARYTNDRAELRMIDDLLLERVKDHPKMNHLMNSFLTDFRRTLDETYISCFSEDGDSLFQWTNYASAGTGFALGFNISTKDQLFQKVIYDIEQVRGTIEEMYTSLDEFYQNNIPEGTKEFAD